MKYALALCLLALSGAALATEKEVSFSYQDWEVVCDNTLTCRIAGYSDQDESGGSILLTRQAGPNAPIEARVTLADTNDDEKTPAVSALSLWINNKRMGDLTRRKDHDWQLTAAQHPALVRAVKGSDSVEFRSATKSFTLSGRGAYAVMLKADDVQGRVDTPGALARRGNRPEKAVPPAVPAPVIHQVRIDKSSSRELSAAEIAALKPRLLATLSNNANCDINDGEDPISITLTSLDDRQALLSTLCWRGAYNEGYGYWVIDSELTQTPQLITDSGSDYQQGEIFASHRGRGIGDCLGSALWVWDGKTFRHAEQSTSGMCRYIHLGGTWTLPTQVSTIVKP